MVLLLRILQPTSTRCRVHRLIMLKLQMCIRDRYSKKRRLLRMEKEYHLVSAISSIYLSNLLIHPQDDTWEPIVQSDRMKAITNGVSVSYTHLGSP